ncbi:hypothetical protein HDU76_009805, partial [Blyttiomyces sp. JEL0837]
SEPIASKVPNHHCTGVTDPPMQMEYGADSSDEPFSASWYASVDANGVCHYENEGGLDHRRKYTKNIPEVLVVGVLAPMLPGRRAWGGMQEEYDAAINEMKPGDLGGGVAGITVGSGDVDFDGSNRLGVGVGVGSDAGDFDGYGNVGGVSYLDGGVGSFNSLGQGGVQEAYDAT